MNLQIQWARDHHKTCFDRYMQMLIIISTNEKLNLNRSIQFNKLIMKKLPQLELVTKHISCYTTHFLRAPKNAYNQKSPINARSFSPNAI